MGIGKKMKKMFAQDRDHAEMSTWLFSLTPLGIAFCFYFVFLLPMDIPNKDLLYVVGAAAGFSGLQAYWIARGWKRNEGMTVVLGILGIGFAILLTWAYIGLTR
ncbi:MAG: hypothetical protein PVG45_09590 [Gammaproteobacteria bacterium]|jgi:hypothetical protein